MCVDLVSKHHFSLKKLNLIENTHAGRCLKTINNGFNLLGTRNTGSSSEDLKRKSKKRHSKKKGYAAPLFAGIVAVAEPSEAFELTTYFCSFKLMNSIRVARQFPQPTAKVVRGT